MNCSDYFHAPWVIILNDPWFLSSTSRGSLSGENFQWVFIRYYVNFRHFFSYLLIYVLFLHSYQERAIKWTTD
jgi:hypothetical protein